MKRFPFTSRFMLVVLAALLIGCEPAQRPDGSDQGTGVSPAPACIRYAPVKIDIMPLTEFAPADGSREISRIRLHLSLLDAFGSQIKAPAVFRFELYEQVFRSSEPKGTRLAVWPDADLTDPAVNNRYWRDFLRAYEFSLDFTPQAGHSYILEVTCICPGRKRLSAELAIAAQ